MRGVVLHVTRRWRTPIGFHTLADFIARRCDRAVVLREFNLTMASPATTRPPRRSSSSSSGRGRAVWNQRHRADAATGGYRVDGVRPKLPHRSSAPERGPAGASASTGNEPDGRGTASGRRRSDPQIPRDPPLDNPFPAGARPEVQLYERNRPATSGGSAGRTDASGRCRRDDDAWSSSNACFPFKFAEPPTPSPRPGQPKPYRTFYRQPFSRR